MICTLIFGFLNYTKKKNIAMSVNVTKIRLKKVTLILKKALIQGIEIINNLP